MNENSKHHLGFKYNFSSKLYLEILLYYRKKENNIAAIILFIKSNSVSKLI